MQIINSISCQGFRGFRTEERLSLAIPNGNYGSGLTILVGPNGGGKSTIIECFRLLASRTEVSITEGKRNKLAGDKVVIKLTGDSRTGELRTVDSGGSETKWFSSEQHPKPSVFFLPSRRVFNPYFSKGKTARNAYANNTGNFNFRGQHIDSFNQRLFSAQDNYQEFSKLFTKINGTRIDWTIEQSDQGNYYLKILKADSINHTSDGLGEGIVSLLFLVDALFESSTEEILVIDEPELSLHPQLQRRLLKEICELAVNRQIVIATHSAEMVDIDAIINGATVARIVDENGSKIYHLQDSCRKTFESLDRDLNFPHGFGYESRACLFAEDGVVITEGQEDVVLYNKMLEDLGLDYPIQFWGFGAGGAEKIIKIAKILNSLGFKKIGALFDGDKANEAEEFRKIFPGYMCWVIPADDIRDKIDSEGNLIKKGIFGIDRKIKDNYVTDCKRLVVDINNFVNVSPSEDNNSLATGSIVVA